MADISIMRSSNDPVEAAMFRITVRSATYEIDINTLTFAEKQIGRRLLGAGREIVDSLVAYDDDAPYVLAYLAVRRVNPDVDFDAEIGVLTNYTLNVAIVTNAEDTAPLAADSATPSSTAEPAASGAKATSRKGSTKAA